MKVLFLVFSGIFLFSVLQLEGFADECFSPDSRNTHLVGSAQFKSDQTLEITPAQTHQVGAAWSKQLLNPFEFLTTPTEIKFSFKIDHAHPLSPADGFAFVIQAAGPNALGLGYGGIGFYGIPKSIAIRFDTWKNGPYQDPSAESICVLSKGENHNRPEINLASLGCSSSQKLYGKKKSVRIILFQNTLTVQLNGKNVLTLDSFELEKILGPSPAGYWIGFTGSTGDVYYQRTVISDFKICKN